MCADGRNVERLGKPAVSNFCRTLIRHKATTCLLRGTRLCVFKKASMRDSTLGGCRSRGNGDTMRNLVLVALLAFLFSGGTGFAQTKEPPDPYKPILDRFESLETLPFPEWRYHADMPHPEGPTLSDSDWPTVKIREEWKTGSRVL